MTDLQALAKHSEHRHLSMEMIAYHDGRNSVDDDGSLRGKCEFESPAMIAAWKRGVRSVRSELRLNLDDEWD